METILQRLTDLEDVYDAIIVGKDGLIVSGILHTEDEEVVGAMSAAAFGSISSFTSQINKARSRWNCLVISSLLSLLREEETSDACAWR